jgi:hypothetical protein
MPPDAGAAYGLRVEQFAARGPDSLLRELDADFPLVKPESVGLEVRDGFLGDGYAAATAESLAAVALAEANHHRDNLHRQGAGRAGR